MLQRPAGKKACVKDTYIGSMGVSALASYTKYSEHTSVWTKRFKDWHKKKKASGKESP